MGYELFIFPPEGGAGVPSEKIVEAFGKSGIRCTEQPDDYGHWLVLDGIESVLDLTIKDGFATYAGFRYAMTDDPTVAEMVTAVFKSLGWQVSDEEGFL